MAVVAPTMAAVIGDAMVRQLAPTLLTTVGAWCLSSNSSAPSHKHSGAGTMDPQTILAVKARALELIPRTSLEYLDVKIRDYEESQRHTHARDKLVKDMQEIRDKIMSVCWEIRHKIWLHQRPWFQQPLLGWGVKLDVRNELRRLEEAKVRMSELESQDKKLPVGDFKMSVRPCDTLDTDPFAPTYPQTTSIEGIVRKDYKLDDETGLPSCGDPSCPTEIKPKPGVIDTVPTAAKTATATTDTATATATVTTPGPNRNASLDEVILDFST